jgi:repressor LexA
VNTLTQAQQRVVDVFAAASRAGLPPPTVREICARLGFRSTGTGRDHLAALVRRGVLQQNPGKSRSYRLAGRFSIDAAQLPLLGRVPAGYPVDAVEISGDTFALPASWLDPGRCFAVRVYGDSMVDAGILDGDVAVVRFQATAPVGTIVVARVDGEVTLKRLARRGGRLHLASENPSFAPILADERTEIVGVVVGVVRRYEDGVQRAAAEPV